MSEMCLVIYKMKFPLPIFNKYELLNYIMTIFNKPEKTQETLNVITMF